MQKEDPLCKAARQGNLRKVLSLLKNGANANSPKSHSGYGAALSNASWYGHTKVVELLLQHGADPNQFDSFPIKLAIGEGHINVVKLLIQNGAKINKDGLNTAVRNCYIDLTEYLIQKGAVMDIDFLLRKRDPQDTFISSEMHTYLEALDLATFSYRGETWREFLNFKSKPSFVAFVKHFLQKAANLKQDKENGRSIVISAAYKGCAYLLAYLHERGTNLKEVDNNGRSAIICALWQGIFELAKYLEYIGGDLNEVDNDGRTGYFYAAQRGDTYPLYQMRNAVNVNHTDNNGCTALFHAISHGQFEAIKQLIEDGSNSKHRNKEGKSVFHILAERKCDAQMEIADFLLKNGASVDTKCMQGNTPLHLAALDNNEPLVVLFCDAGLNPMQENNAGETPISLLANNSTLAEKILTEYQSFQKLQKLWLSAKQSKIEEEQLFDALMAENITSFSSFVVAHNLIIVALRQQVLIMVPSADLGTKQDYFLENVYLPATKLSLHDERKQWLSGMLSYAEKLNIIRPGNATLVKVVADLRSEIREARLEMHTAMVSVAREINSLHNRVDRLENWTHQAAECFRSLSEGQQQIFEDMKNMASSLQDLHSLLKMQQRNRAIAGVLGFCFAMIPLVGGALSGASFAASEIALGVGVEDVTTGLQTAADQILSVDISSFQTVSVMMSDSFLQKLDPVSKSRVEAVVQQTDFKTVQNMQQSITEAIEELKDVEFESHAPVAENEINSELSKRFSMLTSDSQMEHRTVTAEDAVSELQHIHQMQAKRGNCSVDIDEDVALDIVMEHMCMENGEVDFDGFVKAYHDLAAKFPFCSTVQEPGELRERFGRATRGRNELNIKIAKVILRSLFNASGSSAASSCSKVSFKRTANDWNDEDVNMYGSAEGTIDEEGFVEAGMKVLFPA